MNLFPSERRRAARTPVAEAVVTFTVRSGKDPSLVSSPVSGTVKDFTDLGMSVVSPRLAPDGIHIMYDTLMTTRNRIDAVVRREGLPSLRVSGRVTWFRGAEEPAGAYIFGMEFDSPPAEVPG